MRTQRRISVVVDCATLYEGSAARNVVADEGNATLARESRARVDAPSSWFSPDACGAGDTFLNQTVNRTVRSGLFLAPGGGGALKTIALARDGGLV
jgi:hypothetical protein